MHTVNDVSDMSLFESHTLGYICLPAHEIAAYIQ